MPTAAGVPNNAADQGRRRTAPASDAGDHGDDHGTDDAAAVAAGQRSAAPQATAPTAPRSITRRARRAPGSGRRTRRGRPAAIRPTPTSTPTITATPSSTGQRPASRSATAPRPSWPSASAPGVGGGHAGDHRAADRGDQQTQQRWRAAMPPGRQVGPAGQHIVDPGGRRRRSAARRWREQRAEGAPQWTAARHQHRRAAEREQDAAGADVARVDPTAEDLADRHAAAAGSCPACSRVPLGH